jgi:hypothetical protein
LFQAKLPFLSILTCALIAIRICPVLSGRVENQQNYSRFGDTPDVIWNAQ